MSKQCVAFARLASANYTVDLDKVDGKTCSELIDFLNDQKLNDETIAISTPCFREALPLESKPIELYKELILSERPTKFDRPDFFICIIPNNDANKKVFYMEAIVQNNISMPRWEVEIDPSDFENELSSSLCSFLISKFPYEIEENTESIILQNDENPVDQTMTALNMIQEMRQSRYKIKCLLSEGTLKKITFRSHIVKEIQSTEKTYIDGLQVLVHFWSNNLIDEKVLSSEEANIVFNDFPNMIKYHSLFLRNLEERGTSFNAILSDVFLDFSAFFKVSKMYISNYATFIQIFANKSKNKETSEKIKRITAAEPTGTNREISSYLITPVQRMPRYILFIRELIKHTPQAHPDAVLLKNAAIQIQKVTEQIDDSTQKAENMSKLLAIHSRLTNKFDLLLPSRNFVMKCDVYVKPQNSSGVFYLFNDMVFLTAIERKGETYIYDKPVEEFKYWNGIPNLESITFLPKSGNIKSRFQSRKDFSIQFSTQEEKNGFLEMVRNIKFELLSRSDDLNRMFIFENCPVSKLLPSVTPPI